MHVFSAEGELYENKMNSSRLRVVLVLTHIMNASRQAHFKV